MAESLPSAIVQMTVSSEHVREPQQERSRQTLERLEKAALEIIAEEGVESATVARIVDRAGSSVGSFYARFDGKDGLLHHLEQRVWAAARERWQDAMRSESWEGLGIEGVVTSVVRLLARIQEEDEGTRRALGGASSLAGDEARRFHEELEEDVARLLLRRRETIRHPDPELAVRMAYRWSVGGIRELLGRKAEPEGGRLDSEADHHPGRNRVVEELSRGITAYLTGEAPLPEEEGEVEFFDVWQ